jgi:hypothetical protein
MEKLDKISYKFNNNNQYLILLAQVIQITNINEGIFFSQLLPYTFWVKSFLKSISYEMEIFQSDLPSSLTQNQKNQILVKLYSQ